VIRVKAAPLNESENRVAIRFFWFSVIVPSVGYFYRASPRRGYRFSVKKGQQLVGFGGTSSG
jgi:hypothetical protein